MSLVFMFAVILDSITSPCVSGSRGVQADRSHPQNRAGYQPVNHGTSHNNGSYGNGFSGFGDDLSMDEGELFW